MHRGKMFVLYKRPGHRVIINMYGDMIVRPSFAEASTQVRPRHQGCQTRAVPSLTIEPHWFGSSSRFRLRGVLAIRRCQHAFAQLLFPLFPGSS